MAASPYEKYRRQDILIADPMKLVVMLYNGCIKQLKLAREAIEKRQYDQANQRLQRSQDIIVELMTSLDLKYAISKELMDLYTFLYREMIKVNITKDDTHIEPLIKILVDLRDTWSEAMKEYKTSKKDVYDSVLK